MMLMARSIEAYTGALCVGSGVVAEERSVGVGVGKAVGVNKSGGPKDGMLVRWREESRPGFGDDMGGLMRHASEV